MVRYKETYEGRLPYALSQNYVENNGKEVDVIIDSYLKKRLLDAALFARMLFKKEW